MRVGVYRRAAWPGRVLTATWSPASFEQMSPEWEEMLQESKFADRPRYGRLLEGHIALQDHWNRVLYRNIRIRVME